MLAGDGVERASAQEDSADQQVDDIKHAELLAPVVAPSRRGRTLI